MAMAQQSAPPDVGSVGSESLWMANTPESLNCSPQRSTPSHRPQARPTQSNVAPEVTRVKSSGCIAAHARRIAARQFVLRPGLDFARFTAARARVRLPLRPGNFARGRVDFVTLRRHAGPVPF